MAVLFNEVLVCYDIENTKQRTKLFKALKGISLIPIQKSVFWGHLNSAEERAVTRMIKQHASSTDKVIITRVKLANAEKLKHTLGYPANSFPSKPKPYHVV